MIMTHSYIVSVCDYDGKRAIEDVVCIPNDLGEAEVIAKLSGNDNSPLEILVQRIHHMKLRARFNGQRDYKIHAIRIDMGPTDFLELCDKNPRAAMKMTKNSTVEYVGY